MPEEGKGLTGMFMVTGIDIPSSGCCEIAAQYVDTSHDVHTIAYLAYMIWSNRRCCKLGTARAELRCTVDPLLRTQSLSRIDAGGVTRGNERRNHRRRGDDRDRTDPRQYIRHFDHEENVRE